MPRQRRDRIMKYELGIMDSKQNYAFIDSQNLNLAIQDQGWKLDFARFRIYLKEKYAVATAYIFIGFVEGNQPLYKSLQQMGYVLIFKPTLKTKDGKVKGNCDAELVLHTMIEYEHYHKAIIVTGDGDLACLVQYLLQKEKLETLLIPNMHKYSALLKKAARKNIAFMNELQGKLEYKKKRTP